jgi:hypothetical protein
MKGLIFICIVLLFIVGPFYLQRMSQDYEAITTIHLLDEETYQGVNANIRFYPSYELKHGPKMLGDGRYRYKISSHTASWIVVKKDGYETKRKLLLLKEEGKNVILLSKEKENEQK